VGYDGLATVRGKGNSHHIETKGSCGGLGGLQVQVSSAYDAGALASIHRFERMPTVLSRASADLNEHQNPTVVCYQVQLPLRSAPVSLDDAIATGLKQGSGQVFSASPESGPSRRP
jgi:hypothetical protein